jgi:flagellar biosynthesis anti-sigma factor FlgM
MKINTNSTVGTSKLQSGQVYQSPRSGGNSSTIAGGAPEAEDNIDLKSHESLLSLAQAAGQSDRSAKVQSLQELVQSGQYHVDPVALSHSIIEAALGDS